MSNNRAGPSRKCTVVVSLNGRYGALLQYNSSLVGRIWISTILSESFWCLGLVLERLPGKSMFRLEVRFVDCAVRLFCEPLFLSDPILTFKLSSAEGRLLDLSCEDDLSVDQIGVLDQITRRWGD